jgi:hypothetical protein
MAEVGGVIHVTHRIKHLPINATISLKSTFKKKKSSKSIFSKKKEPKSKAP